jgi:hypothetical protein
MSRLVFSDGAFVRKLEISKSQVFAFVEGGLDRSFCDKLLTHALSAAPLPYQVIAAKELSGETGGKPRLVALYKFLRQRRMLHFEANGKKATCAIFLDKDIDDLKRCTLRSKHVLYTRTYDLEGELFRHGDLARATADACGLTLQQAKTLLGDQHTWLARHATNWLDWTTLCVISQTRNADVGCSFERTSAVNPQILGAADPAAVQVFQTALVAKLGLSGPKFQRLYKRYRALILNRIGEGKSLLLFKGKWLTTIIEKDVAQKNTLPDVSVQSLGQKVASLLISQVGNHASCRCCAGYEARLQELLTALH